VAVVRDQGSEKKFFLITDSRTLKTDRRLEGKNVDRES
jgi:hypothetical protein